jgi:hypothetical protein
LSFRGDDGAGRSADHGASNRAAAAAERAADDAAKRATDNGAGERILRRRLLRRQQRRKCQKYSCPQRPHHVPSPFICIRTICSHSRNDDAMLFGIIKHSQAKVWPDCLRHAALSNFCSVRRNVPSLGREGRST